MLIYMGIAALVAFIFSRHIDTAVEHDLVAFRNGGRIFEKWTSPSAPVSLPPVASTIHELNLLVDQSAAPVLAAGVTLGLAGDEHALWFFYGTHGLVTAALSRPAIVKTVRLKHHRERRACLARDVVVWGLPIPGSKSVYLDNTSFSWSPLPEQLRTSPPLVPSEGSLATQPVWVPLAHIDGWKSWTSGHTDLDIPPQLVADRVHLYALAVELKGNGGYEATCFPGFSAFGIARR